MRRFLPLLALVLLAGCDRVGGDEGAFTDSRIPPALEKRFWPPPTWAWGLVQIGDGPPVRYGVSAPDAGRRGDVLILAGFGESAEAWFETVTALNQSGYVVWVMDGAGQGGSGRSARPHDLVHVDDLRMESDSVRAMTAVIGRPAVLVAQSTAAPTALRAILDGGRFPAVVLSAPVLDMGEAPVNAPASGETAALAAKAKLGWLRAAGQQPWTASGRVARGRPGVVSAWQQANPDLRSGGASWGWLAAFAAQAGTLQPDALKGISVPVLVLSPGAKAGPRATNFCRALPHCTIQPVPGASGSLHLEGPEAYAVWSSALLARVDQTFAANRDP